MHIDPHMYASIITNTVMVLIWSAPVLLPLIGLRVALAILKRRIKSK